MDDLQRPGAAFDPRSDHRLQPLNQKLLLGEHFDNRKGPSVFPLSIPGGIAWPAGWQTWDLSSQIAVEFQDCVRQRGSLYVASTTVDGEVKVAAKLQPFPAKFLARPSPKSCVAYGRFGHSAHLPFMDGMGKAVIAMLISQAPLLPAGDGAFQLCGLGVASFGAMGPLLQSFSAHDSPGSPTQVENFQQGNVYVRCRIDDLGAELGWFYNWDVSYDGLGWIPVAQINDDAPVEIGLGMYASQANSVQCFELGGMDYLDVFDGPPVGEDFDKFFMELWQTQGGQQFNP